ncbi:MAG: Holliday junction branch migration protein RuvA [Bdellovibrionaceae bacterium]|jgi:Holliday junction DNA helicase RuvA|nr:Holliday junction branch migration protein RuvA [Pseudobdellovibrionaceae bacterium]
MKVAFEGRLFKVFPESVWLQSADDWVYEFLCSTASLGVLSQEPLGERVFIYTYEQIREDGYSLFGFTEWAERELFLNLIKVSGIGPKSAIQILSGASVHDIVRWIDTADVKALCRLPKLGKKTAEQLVLSLKGHLVLSEPSQVTGSVVAVSGSRGTSSTLLWNDTQKKVASALQHLGFRSQDYEALVNSLGEKNFMDVEEGIRFCLSELGRGGH